MNSKKKLLITAAAFVVVIVLGVIAYHSLKNNTDAGNLIEETKQAEEESSQKNDTEQSGNGGSDASGETDGKANPIPEFTMTDADGKKVSISDLSGKPTVINFWASTCPYCIDEMPYFEELYKTMGDEIQFIMLDIVGFNGETENDGRAFIEENGYTFPVYYDTEYEATYALGLRSLPMTLFLDSDGNMTAVANGRIDEEILQKGIDMIK